MFPNHLSPYAMLPTPEYRRSLRLNLLFHLVHYLLLLPVFCRFASQYGFTSSFWQGVWMTLSTLTLPVIYLAPGLLLSCACLLPSRPWCRPLTAVVAIIWTSCLHFTLILDAIILTQFDYHINGLVINLLFTPGGFEAMGLDSATLLPACLGILLGLAANIGIAAACHFWKPADRLASRLFARPAKQLIVAGAVFLLAAFTPLLIGAFADFYSLKDILVSQNSFPLTFDMRMRKFLRRLGLTEPPREKSLFDENSDAVGLLTYPLNPIQRTPEHPRRNIIWLTCESLRADMLSPEIMPNAWKLASENIHCPNHYSGGHGTRPAMFSMFYGLYGNNWNTFLNCRRNPLLFDWLRDDHTDLLCQTSAKFSYPEFNQTIFASVPEQNLAEITDPHPWKRDQKLTDRLLDFVAAHADGTTPFFTFAFFEATHAPYSFDETAALRTDYIPNINYATVSKTDAPKLLNRAINAAHGIDRQIGRILAAVNAAPALRDNTIIVITGDHGEEFFEKGRLGHNSTFVEEQIRTPLAIRIPGVPPTRVPHWTHHTDIIPTLAPALGVTNPPSDFSVGQNILAPDYQRPYFIVCGWQIETFITPDAKYIIPTGGGAKYYGRNLFTNDDQPAKFSQDDFLAKYSAQLFDANTSMAKFVRPAKK